VATNLSSFRPSPASGKEVADTFVRRTCGGQEESSQEEGGSQEEGSQEEDREEKVARPLLAFATSGSRATSCGNRLAWRLHEWRR
jgi:hypothetical protein